jgi:hypothetical protein
MKTSLPKLLTNKFVVRGLSFLLLFGICYFSTNDKQVVRISDILSAQVYDNLTLEELNKLPKADRPDLGVIQNADMTRDPSLNTVPVERTLQAFEAIKHRSGARVIDNVSWTERAK